jgi:hypothetical protein
VAVGQVPVNTACGLSRMISGGNTVTSSIWATVVGAVHYAHLREVG